MRLASGKRALLLVLAASLCVTAALAIGILLFGDFGETEGRILGTTALIAGFSLLALPAGLLLDQGRLAPLAWAGIALPAAGLVLALVVLWEAGGWEPWGRLTATAAAFAVAAAQVTATASRLRPDDARPVGLLFAASTALVLVLATMVAVTVWVELDSETYARLLAAGAVANVLLVALQPLVRRTGKPRGRPGFVLRVEAAGGASRELAVEGRDFAEAAARAIREAERGGLAPTRIERLDPAERG
jgi:hypothetical protein